MSVLNDVLREEYERINRVIVRVENEIDELPKGYLSYKKINGKEYCYYQFREERKIRSVYLKQNEVEDYKRTILQRNELISKLRELKADKKKLEKVLK